MKRVRKLGLPLLLPRSTSFILLFFIMALTSVLDAWPTNFFRGSRIGYARNIRPIHCVDRTKTIGGICMFAWDCMKANGTHLGTCIDRFYFGSCCKIGASSLPQLPALEDGGLVPPPTTEEEEIYEDNAQKITESLSETHESLGHLDASVSSKDPNIASQSVGMISEDDEIEPGHVFFKPVLESDITSSQVLDTEFDTIKHQLELETVSGSAAVQETNADTTGESETESVSGSQIMTSPEIHSKVTLPPDTSNLPSLSDDDQSDSKDEVLEISSKPMFVPVDDSETVPTDDSLTLESNLETDSQVVSSPEEETEYKQTLEDDSDLTLAIDISIDPEGIEISNDATTQNVNDMLTENNKIPSTDESPFLIFQDKHQTTLSPEFITVSDIDTESSGDNDYLLIPEVNLESEIQDKPGTESPTEMLPGSKPESEIDIYSTTELSMDTEQLTDTTTHNFTTEGFDSSHKIEETTIEYEADEEEFKPFGLADIEPESDTVEAHVEPELSKDNIEPSTTPVSNETEVILEAETVDETTLSPLLRDKTSGEDESSYSLETTTQSIVEIDETSTLVSDDILPATEEVPGTTNVIEEVLPIENTSISPETIVEVDTSEKKPSEDSISNEDEQVQTTTMDILEASVDVESVTSDSIASETERITTLKTDEKPSPSPSPSPSAETTPVIIAKPTVPSFNESTQNSSSTEKSTVIPNSWDQVEIIEEGIITTSSSPSSSTSSSLPPPTSPSITLSSSSASSASPAEGELESSTSPTHANTSETSIESMSPTEQEKVLVQMLQMANYKDICGKPVYPISRIVGGLEASYGEWPWQVSLRQWRSVAFLHKCGSALVNENWAITAAHCVEGIEPDQLLLVMGEYDLGTTKEPYGHVERSVQVIAMHPKFEPRTFEYDLALLRFSEPVTFQPNIIPICIPNDDYNFLNNTGYVTGWGRLYEDGPLPTVMQKVPVPVIPNSDCEAMYMEAGYVEHIPNIFICAGYQAGKQDSCEGDSGGPMVINYKGRWRLAGIISWGIGCAVPNQPGVYTRISEFREWINKIIRF